MSLTIVQRFYEVAKQQAEAPALGISYDGDYHDLPWWFVKSKAKHFGIGLLEEGAREGEYFYLLSSPHPTWSYAELGALTIGLRTLPLPEDITETRLEALFHRYPPAFFYLGDKDLISFQAIFSRHRGLRRVILPTEAPPNFPMARSFRKIFNEGIRSESRHHETYRRIRQGLEENREMSPLRVGADGELDETPLRYGDVNEACAKLSHALAGGKARRLLSNADLSRSFARIACLYWPIFSAIQSVFVGREEDLFSAARKFRPEALFLRRPQLATLEKWVGVTGTWRRFWLRRRLRFQWGGRLRCLFSEVPLPEDLAAKTAWLRLRTLAAAPETANFLL